VEVRLKGKMGTPPFRAVGRGFSGSFTLGEGDLVIEHWVDGTQEG